MSSCERDINKEDSKCWTSWNTVRERIMYPSSTSGDQPLLFMCTRLLCFSQRSPSLRHDCKMSVFPFWNPTGPASHPISSGAICGQNHLAENTELQWLWIFVRVFLHMTHFLQLSAGLWGKKCQETTATPSCMCLDAVQTHVEKG